MKEAVDHPTHYNFSKFEVIDVIFDWKLDFCMGNVLKYISRAGKKNNEKEDLKKSLFYLRYFIKNYPKIDPVPVVCYPENYQVEEVLKEWQLPEFLSEAVYLIGNISETENYHEVIEILEEVENLIKKHIEELDVF